jgi:hypothetical protein
VRAYRSLAAAFVLLGAAACTPTDSPAALGAKLEGAQTSADEAALFRRLSRPGMSVRALDREGRTVGMARADWWEQAYRVEITIGGDRISHVLIDRKNVLSLLGE